MDTYDNWAAEKQDDGAQLASGLMRLASSPAQPWIDPLLIAETEVLQQHKAQRAKKEQSASFARGVLASIERLIACRRQRGVEFANPRECFRAAAPYIVEIAELTDRSAYVDALRWLRRFFPSEADAAGLIFANDAVTLLLRERDDAIAERPVGAPLQWLPPMSQHSETFSPTFEEVTALELRGWTAKDRPAAEVLRARKTDLQRKRRHALGARPQSARTQTKVMVEIAAHLGVSLATIKRRRHAPDIIKLISDFEPNVKHSLLKDTVPHFSLTSDAANDDFDGMEKASVSTRAAMLAVRRRFAVTKDQGEYMRAAKAVTTRGVACAPINDNDQSASEAAA